jgi:hypothetical protein
MEILQNKHQQLIIAREDHHRIIRYTDGDITELTPAANHREGGSS